VASVGGLDAQHGSTRPEEAVACNEGAGGCLDVCGSCQLAQPPRLLPGQEASCTSLCK